MPLPLPKGPLPHYSSRINSLWDSDAPKYRVMCKRVHVVRAASVIGYAQLALLAFFTVTLAVLYANNATATYEGGQSRYFSSVIMAVGVQLCLVCMMLHGIKVERRSFMLPFIVFATLAAFLAVFQLSFDYTYRSRSTLGSQFLTHVIGILVHIWSVHVVWRCYCYLGDKKVACAIEEQLQASLAFSYEPVVVVPQPPAYTDCIPAEKTRIEQ